MLGAQDAPHGLPSLSGGRSPGGSVTATWNQATEELHDAHAV